MYETGLGTPQIKVPHELGPMLMAVGPELGHVPEWATSLEDWHNVLVWGIKLSCSLGVTGENVAVGCC